MKYVIFSMILFMISCKSNSQKINHEASNEAVKVEENVQSEFVPSLVKSNDEWKSILTEQEYYVLREAGTERAFTGDLLKNKKEGIYTCAACDNKLFKSETKFDSGTGWPSYYEPYNEDSVHEDTDYKLGYPRTEILCKRCGGHLGHVFNDGPKPTGLRYCMNSIALNFEESE